MADVSEGITDDQRELANIGKMFETLVGSDKQSTSASHAELRARLAAMIAAMSDLLEHVEKMGRIERFAVAGLLRKWRAARGRINSWRNSRVRA